MKNAWENFAVRNSTSTAERRWPASQWASPPEVSADVAAAISHEHSLHISVARILSSRGWTDSQAIQEHLNPSLKNCVLPHKLPGIEKAATIIGRHVAEKNKIVVFGDFDADGMTAATVLHRMLVAIGANDPRIFIPNRISEGYGFTEAALDRCLSENPEAKLIVTVDCGISHAPACDKAVAAGLDVVVTDHHEVSKSVPASALALVNPCLDGTPEPLKHLCGAGVAFKLAHELGRRYLPRNKAGAVLNPLIAITAVGTVGDLVPLKGENRILAAAGLRILNENREPSLVGLQALRQVSNRASAEYTAQDLAFALVPRINAAGRVGDPMDALSLLAATDRATAQSFAKKLDEYNNCRRDEEKDAVSAADAVLQQYDETPPAIVLFDSEWHPGVIGLVASRLSNRYHRPTVVLTADEAPGMLRGSARCPEIPGLDLMQLLGACHDVLEGFGGHRAAAGLTVSRDKLEEFRNRFAAVCEETERELDMRTESLIEAWLQPEDIEDAQQCQDLLRGLARLGPYGTLNPEPLLGMRSLTLSDEPRRFGKTTTCWGFLFDETATNAILFGVDDIPFHKGDKVDIVFHFGKDRYDEPQFVIRDMRFTP